LFGKEGTKIDSGLTMAVTLTCISFFMILGSDYGTSTRSFAEGQEKRQELTYKKDFESFMFQLRNEGRSSGRETVRSDQALSDTSEINAPDHPGIELGRTGDLKKTEVQKR
jgi:hypothetical protein